MDEECQYNKPSCYASSTVEDDSILEFKSPKSEITKSKLSEYTKPNVTKQKKKTVDKFKHSAKTKPTQAKHQSERRKTSHGSQPSIESTFFKSKNDSDKKESFLNKNVALVCPLCFKTFKDADSQVLHMKLCAFKNNISTKKLLDIIELQKRQEDERKSLGLLAAPIIQDRKKSVPRKVNSHEDPDLQLALALSKSLKEAEELEEIDEIERLAEIPNQFVSEISEAIYKNQLESFGFASDKPAAVPKTKRRKYNEVTPLQIRTEEERNRILTERIAEILTGNEPITQMQKVEVPCNQDIGVEIVLKSHLLQTLCCKENKLWDKARLTPSQKSFYVSDLSEHIIPEENQVEANEEVVQLNACGIKDINCNQNKMEACNNEIECYEIFETDSNLVNKRCDNCDDKQFIDTLVMNWGNALNDSSASDIIIFVTDNKHIWAHKLVFYVRCSNLLLEVVPNDTSSFTTIKEKICWFDISYDIALGFLEFIYCGIIKKYCNILTDLTNFSCLRNLARKYRVKELFVYLQQKEDEIKQAKVEVCNAEDSEYENDTLKLNSNISIAVNHDRKDVLSLCQSEEANDTCSKESITNNSGFSENILKDISPVANETLVSRNFNTQRLEETVSMKGWNQSGMNCSAETNDNRHSNVSPDMFDDENLCDRSIYTQATEKDEDLNSVKSIIFDSVNDIMEITNCLKITNDTLITKSEVRIDSLLNTPRSIKKRSNDVNDCSIVKTRSNLSLFIEQCQKENAKSDSDIDSETSLLPASPLTRNPFNVKLYDSSTEFSRLCKNDIVKETEEKQNTPKKCNYNTTNHESNVESISLDSESDMDSSFEALTGNSMESIKYNAENSGEECTKNNSIKENENDTDTEIQNEATQKNANITNSQYNEEQVSIPSDFEMEEIEISMYARYKKEHQNNSITKYRNFVKENIINDSVKSSSESEEKEIRQGKRKESTDKKDITELSNIDMSSDFAISEQEHVNQTDKEEPISDLIKSTPTVRKKSQNLNNGSSLNDSDENNFFVDITTPISCRNSPSVQQTNNSSKLKHSKSEGHIVVETVKNNLFNSFTQSNTTKFKSPESPILVCSSPEFDLKSLNRNNCNESTHHNVSKLKEPDDFSRILEKDIYLANVRVTEDSDTNDDEKNISPPVSKRKSTEKPLAIKESNRKFQRKSMSETNLNSNIKRTKNNSLEFQSNLNKTLCKCGHEKTARTITTPTIIRDNVTPPPDYDGMKTPELHAALNKYGLKAQKRKRAVKLLTYIYNELHPLVSKTPEKMEFECAVISSEDEGPPLKRRNRSKTDVDGIDDCEDELPTSPASTHSMQSSINMIEEEREFDKSESTTQIHNASNVKDAFSSLIKHNKELYNNILAYEPICIDSLHSMLKEKGFKGKKTILMDFLDEQCITFYCQEMKQRKNIRKRF